MTIQQLNRLMTNKKMIFFVLYAVVNPAYRSAAFDHREGRGIVSTYGPTDYITSSEVTAAVYSNDDSVVATVAEDKMIRFINLKTGRILQYFKSNLSSCNTISYSRDDKLLAIGGAEGVEVWNPKSKSICDTVRYEKNLYPSYQFFTAKDNMILIITKNGKAILRNVKTHKNILEKRIAFEEIAAACVSSDRKSAAVVVRSGDIIYLNSMNLSVIKTRRLFIHQRRPNYACDVEYIAFLPNSLNIIMLSDCEILTFIDDSIDRRRSFDMHQLLDKLGDGGFSDFFVQAIMNKSGDGIALACGGGGRSRVIMLNLRRGYAEASNTFVVDSSHPVTLLFTPDDKSLVLFDDESKMMIVDLKTFKITAGGSYPKFVAGTSKSGYKMLTSSFDYSSNLEIIDCLSLKTENIIKVDDKENSIDHLIFQNDNVVVRFQAGYRVYYKSKNYQNPDIIHTSIGSFSSYALSNDAKYIITSDQDESINLIDTATKNERVLIPSIPDDAPLRIGFTDDGKHIYLLYSNRVMLATLDGKASLAATFPSISNCYISNDNIYVIYYDKSRVPVLARCSLGRKNMVELRKNIQPLGDFVLTRNERTIIYKNDKTRSVGVYAIGSSEPLELLDAGDSEIFKLYLTHDDKYVVASCLNGAVLVRSLPPNP